MNRILTSMLTVFLMAGVFAFSGCGDGSDAESSDTAAVAVGTAIGQAAPSITLAGLDGGSLSLEDLRGKAVLLDFWDTWCPPCREALPHLQELSTKYGDEMTVVGIALGQEGEAKVRSFVASRGLTFPMGVGDQDLFQNYGVVSLPTTFLLDDEGIVRKMWIGGYPKAEYEQAIQTVLGS